MVMVAMRSMLALQSRWQTSLTLTTNDQRLSTSDFSQFLEERRIRYSRRIRPANRRLTFRAQCGHRKRHRNAVITERIEGSAMQMLAPRNPHSIGPLFDFRAHFPQIGRDRSDAIRLLHPQLFGIANFEPAVGVRRNRRQHRNLINQHGRIGASDYSSLPRRSPRLNRPYQLALMFFQMRDRNLQPHLHQDIEQPRPRRIHQNPGQCNLRSRKKRRRTKKKRSTRKIARHMRLNRAQPLSTYNPRRVPVSFDFRPKSPERNFAMIARADRLLDHGLALGKQSGKQHTRFHLRARDFRPVMNRLQKTTVNSQRRASAFRGLDPRAHF